MINNPVVFYISAFLIICFALLSVSLKNIIYSLLAAIMVFFSSCIIFYILGSEYNAIIQAVIYGFAVPVIIGLSIMFSSGKNNTEKESTLPVILLVMTLLFSMAFIYMVMISLSIMPDTFHLMKLQQFNSYDVISEFARGIFIDYVWAFELMSLLLTIIIAGLTMYRGKHRWK